MSMPMCVHVYICHNVYACACVHVHVYACACVHVHVYICHNVHACVCTRVHVMCIYMYVVMSMPVCVCAFMLAPYITCTYRDVLTCIIQLLYTYVLSLMTLRGYVNS